MPSDLAKKKAAKKKEAAKARQRPKKDNGDPAPEEAEHQAANGCAAPGQCPVQQHRGCQGRRGWAHMLLPSVDVDEVTRQVEEFELRKAEARAVTGVLASHPNSTDVHVINLSLTFHGQELLSDTTLELNSGRRYGLIGLNGTEQRCCGVGRGSGSEQRCAGSGRAQGPEAADAAGRDVAGSGSGAGAVGTCGSGYEAAIAAGRDVAPGMKHDAAGSGVAPGHGSDAGGRDVAQG
ncbi:hypothetical protein GDO81_021332 [Engystomops pustulosus]|uniref:Uncharacterized protein n=1 Tax=Engystomops pustulosus TaxID=76066 RepID=A0AAV6Z6D4_ENGPU|nr:hypothetical protein GDO81_021332 [Engystomops pustulosus]